MIIVNLLFLSIVVHDYCGQDNPCLNGGQCHNKESGYECKCAPGYRGDDCAGVLIFYVKMMNQRRQYTSTSKYT